MRRTLPLLASLALLHLARPAPPAARRPKQFSFLDYPAPNDGADYALDGDDLVDAALGRALPPYNSPVYYIRLPAHPYVYLPGLGYVSAPPPTPFLDLPLPFVANGKPSHVYRWAGQGGPPPAPPKRKRPPPPDSSVHRLPGSYSFNGKPAEEVFVLRDSYNSMLSDVLQNVYP